MNEVKTERRRYPRNTTAHIPGPRRRPKVLDPVLLQEDYMEPLSEELTNELGSWPDGLLICDDVITVDSLFESPLNELVDGEVEGPTSEVEISDEENAEAVAQPQAEAVSEDDRSTDAGPVALKQKTSFENPIMLGSVDRSIKE